MTADNSVPGRLVIRLPNWLGDVVMALLRRRCPRGPSRPPVPTVAAIGSIAPVFEEVTPARPQRIVVVDKPQEAALLRASSGHHPAAAERLDPGGWRSGAAFPTAGIRSRDSRSAVDLCRPAATPRDAPVRLLRRARAWTWGSPSRKRHRALPRHWRLGSEPNGSTDFRRIGPAHRRLCSGAQRMAMPSDAADRVAQVATRLVRERHAACVLVGLAPTAKQAVR